MEKALSRSSADGEYVKVDTHEDEEIAVNSACSLDSAKKEGFWATVMDYKAMPDSDKANYELSSSAETRYEGAQTTGESSRGQQKNQCQHCMANFSHRSSLYRHVRTMHQRAYPYRCSICTSAFGEKSNLEKHIQIIHERRRPFVCKECNAAFQQRAHLDGHTRTVHLKQRPYECSRCPAAFGQKPHLSRHIRTVHEKIRSFQCDHCDIKFSERRSLENHKRVKHPSLNTQLLSEAESRR